MARIFADDRDFIVGAKLGRLRNKAKITRKALAASLGISTTQFQKYQQGTNRVSDVVLYILSRRLNVPVAEFFDGLDPESTASSKAAEMQEINLAEQVALLASELEVGPRKRLQGILTDLSDMLR